MAKRFLVPLDRSVEAESAVPLVASAARDAGASVRLIHVEPVPGNILSAEGRIVAYADQEMARLEAAGNDYMGDLAERYLHGVAVDCVVRFGEPAEEILREAEAYGAEMIVATTRCRSGISRQVLGSIAEALVRRAPQAVVLVRPAQNASSEAQRGGT